MKVGINLGPWQTRPEGLVDLVRRVEELGYESVWTSEHLVLPAEFVSRYPYSPDGVPPFRPETPLTDPLTLLAYIAAVTSRVRLGTNIYILPLRNPFFAARSAVTVDMLSRGRLILGVGVGWLEEEFSLVGEDFHNRGRRAEECVQVLKALWTQEEPEFHGRFFNFESIKFEPKPLQQPHPPIIFSGETDVALRRAALLGDGWCGIGHTPESAAPQIEKLWALRRAGGRENEPFEITVGAAPWPAPGTWVDVDGMRRYREAGVDRLIVAPWAHIKEAKESLERYAREVLSKLAQGRRGRVS